MFGNDFIWIHLHPKFYEVHVAERADHGSTWMKIDGMSLLQRRNLFGNPDRKTRCQLDYNSIGMKMNSKTSINKENMAQTQWE